LQLKNDGYIYHIEPLNRNFPRALGQIIIGNLLHYSWMFCHLPPARRVLSCNHYHSRSRLIMNKVGFFDPAITISKLPKEIQTEIVTLLENKNFPEAKRLRDKWVEEQSVTANTPSPAA
jgi:hypothetical protein